MGECFFWYQTTQIVPVQRAVKRLCVCVCSQCAMKLNEINIYLVFFLVTQQAKTTHFTFTVGKTIQNSKKMPVTEVHCVLKSYSTKIGHFG